LLNTGDAHTRSVDAGTAIPVQYQTAAAFTFAAVGTGQTVTRFCVAAVGRGT
jgi:hypothetical protein